MKTFFSVGFLPLQIKLMPLSLACRGEASVRGIKVRGGYWFWSSQYGPWETEFIQTIIFNLANAGLSFNFYKSSWPKTLWFLTMWSQIQTFEMGRLLPMQNYQVYVFVMLQIDQFFQNRRLGWDWQIRYKVKEYHLHIGLSRYQNFDFNTDKLSITIFNIIIIQRDKMENTFQVIRSWHP